MTGSSMCTLQYFARISASTSCPDRPGIWMSSMTTSGIGWRSSIRRAKHASASSPLMAFTMVQFGSRAPLTTSWLTGSSSTLRTSGRHAGRTGAGAGSVAGAVSVVMASAFSAPFGGLVAGSSGCALASMPALRPAAGCTGKMPAAHGMETVKVDPTPNEELIRMHPPCAFATSAQTARPSPMPWKLRASLPACDCSKGRKMRSCASLGIPGPVSATSTSSLETSLRCLARKTTEPLAVNLQALVTRL
mmetsp:Transcript_26541/g.76405  ORF Transcript_26541/g.76405 Transcript_26541/m.76405 type:complete len:248 (-) Transcript_26541:1853-2596(-)